MKKLIIVGLSAALSAGLSPALAAAAPGPKARIFAKYDTNKNGVIDGGEVAVVRKAFAADPKGEFARYDVNQDSKLDDAEIAGIKPPGASGKKGKSGEKKEAGKKTVERD